MPWCMRPFEFRAMGGGGCVGRLLISSSSTSVVASVYGDPIGTWFILELTNFSFVFQSRAGFYEDLSGWNTSKAVTMRGMFQGATSFNQDLLAAWDGSRLRRRVDDADAVVLTMPSCRRPR